MAVTCLAARMFQVFCRFELNNTFTSIMGQKDGSVGFQRRYGDYVGGFGYQSTNNFWLGLNNIKRLTDIGESNSPINELIHFYRNLLFLFVVVIFKMISYGALVILLTV